MFDAWRNTTSGVVGVSSNGQSVADAHHAGRSGPPGAVGREDDTVPLSPSGVPAQTQPSSDTAAAAAVSRQRRTAVTGDGGSAALVSPFDAGVTWNCYDACCFAPAGGWSAAYFDAPRDEMVSSGRLATDAARSEQRGIAVVS